MIDVADLMGVVFSGVVCAGHRGCRGRGQRDRRPGESSRRAGGLAELRGDDRPGARLSRADSGGRARGRPACPSEGPGPPTALPGPGCKVQTFREQVPGVLERYQRRTMRLTGQVSAGVRKNVADRAGARVSSAASSTSMSGPHTSPGQGQCPSIGTLQAPAPWPSACSLPGILAHQDHYGGTDQLTALFAESGQKHVPGGLLPIAVCHLGELVSAHSRLPCYKRPDAGGSPVSRSTDG
jgi:hypothetical protein